MTNDQLDQRVAKLLGWDEKSRNGVDYWVAKDGVRQYRADGWSPSTNLTQAMGLWAEHCPEGYHVKIVVQGLKHDVRVVHDCDGVRTAIYRRSSPLPPPPALSLRRG